MKQWKFYPGMKTLEAGWSGKECRGAGKGLWHKETECAISNSRGSWLPSLKARGCSLPDLHHSGHGRWELKLGWLFFHALGHGLGRPEEDRESWIVLQRILIRGKASLRILYFYIQVFHENGFWGELTSFPSFDFSGPDRANVWVCGPEGRTWPSGRGMWDVLSPAGETGGQRLPLPICRFSLVCTVLAKNLNCQHLNVW